LSDSRCRIWSFVSTTSFDVTAQNRAAEAGTHGDANPGVE
jgi:hypothetical protein